MPDPVVDFVRLFQLARNTVRPSHFQGTSRYHVENFATAILALAIRDQSRPVEHLFSKLAAFDRPVIKVEVATQLRVGGEPGPSTRRELGIVDLMLFVTRDDGSTGEVWVEVKAGAPVTAKQLRVYQYARDHADVPGPRTIVILRIGYEDIPAEFAQVPHFTWSELRAQVQADDGRYWRSLVEFLGTHHLVDSVPSLDPDERLVDAVDRALAQCVADRVAWTKGARSPWLRSASIRAEMQKRATEGVGHVVRLWSRRSVRLEVGESHRQPGALGVELGYAWDVPVPNEALRRLAAAADLHGPWKHLGHRPDNGVLVASAPWPADGAVDAAERWFVDRILELRRAGLLVDLDLDGHVTDARAPFSSDGRWEL